MMVPVVRSPPHRAALHAASAPKPHNELHGAGGFKTLVGKIAVIKAGNGKHANHVHRHCNRNRNRTYANKKHAQTHQMHAQKWQYAQPVNFVLADIYANFINRCGVKPRG